MDPTFIVPEWAVGRFAVVKLWPDIKAAEDENIARLKNCARELGLKCIEITPDGEIIGSGGGRINSKNCDFVIHLHFETPKAYDVFSFVALWNPLKFYHDWGYGRFSKHLLTHDDFLSCQSSWADDHVRRLVSRDPYHLPPELTMFHSLSTPIHPPMLKQRKIFYAGINWERLGKGKSRHQELLDLLEKYGLVSIYGPKIFQGVRVWEGYKSYVKELPFDGVSMIDELAACGIGLVLSSEAHKQSELMSNRLFECLAAGALPICDENPFAQKFFGDTLLYIDSRLDVDDQFSQVEKHVHWANDNPNAALELVEQAQAIFLKHFTLDKSLKQIYGRLPERKARIKKKMVSEALSAVTSVGIGFLLPRFSAQVLESYVESLNTQDYDELEARLFIDEKELEEWGSDMQSIIAQAKRPISIVPLYMDVGWRQDRTSKALLGCMLAQAIPELTDTDFFLFVAPNERLFSSHVQVLVTSLLRDPGKAWTATAVLYLHTDGKAYHHDYGDALVFNSYRDNRPMGFGRFLFRTSMVCEDVAAAMRYLDKLALAPLITAQQMVCESPASLVIEIQKEFPAGPFDKTLELAVLGDYTPWLMSAKAETTATKQSGSKDQENAPIIQVDLDNLAPRHLSFKNLSQKNKTTLLAALLSATLPKWVIKPIFAVYDFFQGKNK